MKKQFENSKKKNGFPILICVISVTLILGMLAGCSIMESTPVETQIDASQEEIAEDTNTPTVIKETQESEEPSQNYAPNSEQTLSTDGQEIKSIVEKFVTAYFNGDIDTIQNYLTIPYEWDIDVYTGTGVISEVNLKGLTNIGEEEIGNIKVVSLEYRDSIIEETLSYLTLELIKREEGWKIQFYGIEG